MDIKSFAKINLTLNVFPKQDGEEFHQLDSIFLPIDLFDVIEITENDRTSTSVTCDTVSIGDNNSITKAVNLMREKYHFKDNFHISVHKEIPVQAGLGGGSSNAASVMLFLNKYLKIHAPLGELIELGKQIGSDVPFFLLGRPARVTGRGEILSEPIKIKENYRVIIVKPKKGLSTKTVFNEADHDELLIKNNDEIVKYLETGDSSFIKDNLNNSLLPAATRLVPEIASIIQMLKDDEFHVVSMTGSGSSVFALFKNDRHWLFSLVNKYKKMGYFVRIVEVKK